MSRHTEYNSSLAKDILTLINSGARKINTLSKIAATVTKSVAGVFNDTVEFVKEGIRRHEINNSISLIEEALASEKDMILKWKSKEYEKIMAIIDDLKTLVNTDVQRAALKVKELNSEIDSVVDKVQKLEEDEAKCKYLSESLISSLVEMGFVTEAAMTDSSNPSSPVVITACKPSGKKITIIVDHKSSIDLDMEGYHEKACEYDANSLKQILENCYGVELSAETSSDKPSDSMADYMNVSNNAEL